MARQQARAELRALVEQLDVPDCSCPLLLSCPCGESCREWAHDTCPACLALVGLMDVACDGPPCALHCRHCCGECDCPPQLFQPPCHHQVEAGRRCEGLSFAEFARLVKAAFPGCQTGRGGEDGCHEPPPPASPGVAMSRKEVVDLMERRARRGLSLWHHDDVRDPVETRLQTVAFRPAEKGRAAKLARLRNGAENVVLLTDEVRRAVEEGRAAA